MARTRVLVADHDLDTLSKIYLTLVHRDYKAEACNKADEIPERIKRHKPAVVILSNEAYQQLKGRIKVPAIILVDQGDSRTVDQDEETIVLMKPVPMDTLIQEVQKLVV